MSTEPLKLVSIEKYPGNQYEPRHTRAVYLDSETGQFIARATICEEVIVEVSGKDDLLAWMILSKRLLEVFRAMKQAY